MAIKQDNRNGVSFPLTIKEQALVNDTVRALDKAGKKSTHKFIYMYGIAGLAASVSK